jgi:hypothetical protein
VLETHAFARSAKDAGLSEEEVFRIKCFISDNPQAGALIPGTGGARKIRFPAPGRGKRGGYRVITYFAADDIPVFLLEVFAKGEKINLSQAERNELRGVLGGVADAYRASVKRRVRSLKEKAS